MECSIKCWLYSVGWWCCWVLFYSCWFGLVFLSNIGRRVMKSLITIVNFSVFPFSSISFWFSYFSALLSVCMFGLLWPHGHHWASPSPWVWMSELNPCGCSGWIRISFYPCPPSSYPLATISLFPISMDLFLFILLYLTKLIARLPIFQGSEETCSFLLAYGAE